MIQIAALFLAGLGLFFHGLTGLRQSMEGLASRRMRAWLSRFSRYPFLAGTMGMILGGLTQSVTAVAFIVASMVGGGLLTVRRALPVVACANLGTAALVLVAGFDVQLAVLLVLGIMGLWSTFDLHGSLRPVVVALFFAALLFFGLRQMKDAFAPVSSMPWFAHVAALAQGSLWATFLLGAALRLVIQSSPAIAVIAITLSRAGILRPDQVMTMMFGTGLGVGGAVFLLSTHIRGVSRQIAVYQALLSMTAGLLTVGLFIIERATDWPLLVHAVQKLPGNDALRLAYAFVAMQLIAVLVALLTARYAARWLEKLAPPTAEQDLGRPEFIHDQAVRYPESALDLAAKEQLRLLRRLTLFVDRVRPDAGDGGRVGGATLQVATTSLCKELQAFLGAVAERASDVATSARWLELQRRQSLIPALCETAHDFAAMCLKLREEKCLDALLRSLPEGMHALQGAVVEAFESPSAGDREMLLAMTADRGEMMEQLRRGALAAAPGLSQEGRLNLVYLTSLFEREVWLLRQLVQTLPLQAETSTAG